MYLEVFPLMINWNKMHVSSLQLCSGSPILGFSDRKCECVNATLEFCPFEHTQVVLS